MLSELTKDASKLLHTIYKTYKERIDSGMDIECAVRFGSSSEIQKELFSHASVSNVDHWCRELSRNNYLNCFYADNQAYFVSLSDKAISELEDELKNNIKGLFNAATQLI